MPKYLFGRPIDQVSGALARRTAAADPDDPSDHESAGALRPGGSAPVGLPRPQHPMWREHATLSQELLPAIGHGRISVKPNIARLDGDAVAFHRWQGPRAL